MEAVEFSFELAVPLDQMPGTTPFATGTDLIHLLGIVAELEQFQDERPRRVDWRIATAAGGSATLRSHSNTDVASRAALTLVRGFGDAEASEQLPRAWSLSAGRRAERVAGRLGDTLDTGLRLAATGTEPAEAYVTRRAGRHLRSATDLRFTSYGSVVGVLGRVTAHAGRRAAALWSDLNGRRIEVRFGEQHIEDMRDAWAHNHVEVTGFLHENVAGQTLRVDMQSLDVLDPTRASLIESMPRGFYREMTGGVSAAEYLKAVRGEE